MDERGHAPDDTDTTMRALARLAPPAGPLYLLRWIGNASDRDVQQQFFRREYDMHRNAQLKRARGLVVAMFVVDVEAWEQVP